MGQEKLLLEKQVFRSKKPSCMCFLTALLFVLHKTWLCLQIQGHRIKVSTYTQQLKKLISYYLKIKLKQNMPWQWVAHLYLQMCKWKGKRETVPLTSSLCLCCSSPACHWLITEEISNGIRGRYLAMGMIKDGNTSECRDKGMAFDLCWLENKVTILFIYLFFF